MSDRSVFLIPSFPHERGREGGREKSDKKMNGNENNEETKA